MEEGSKVIVIGSDHCSSQMVELAVVRKVMPKSDGTIFVLNSSDDGNVIFKTEDTSSKYSFGHKKRVLLDSNGATIVTFQNKIKSVHYRWRVYNGSSEDKKDLIFTAKQSKMFGSNRELNVFLASNKDEKTCDFKVASSSDKIYAGDSDTNIIAEINDYKVKIYPVVDQAFIISLIVILDGINQQRDAYVEGVHYGMGAHHAMHIAMGSALL